MTARGPVPVPARITMALDAINAYGPEVDRALGGEEPMVDDWEAGKYLPTPEQVAKLAEMTGHPVEFFYRPADELDGTVTFICDRRRRGENALTVIKTNVDYDGVLHREQLTPDRPPYRPRKPATPVSQPQQVITETGEPNWRIDLCDSCKRPIIWAVTVNAKRMPVDSEPPLSGGNVQLEWRGQTVAPLAKVLGVAAQFGKHNLRLSHFASCPDAAGYRRKRGAR